MTRRLVPASLVLALAFLSLAAAASPAEDAFEKLKSLVGDWETKTAKGSTLRVSYRLASRDSVLVETWAPGTKGETLTVYHLDGPALVATHYCAQGNQPRLAWKAGAEGTWEFAFRDATNLASPADSHLVRLRLTLGDGVLTRVETYSAKGEDETTERRFTRAP